jgi:hypothetical protein
VDVSTGLSTAACLPGFLESATAAALAEHRPVSVVYVRLEHYEDSRNFLGAEGSEGLVRGVARRPNASWRRATSGRPDGRTGPAFFPRRGAQTDDLARSRQPSPASRHGHRRRLFPTLHRIEDLLSARRGLEIRLHRVGPSSRGSPAR